MQGGQRYYIIRNVKTNEDLTYSDPITGYEEVMKFDNERDAEEELAELFEDELIDDVNKYEVISLRW